VSEKLTSPQLPTKSTTHVESVASLRREVHEDQLFAQGVDSARRCVARDAMESVVSSNMFQRSVDARSLSTEAYQ